MEILNKCHLTHNRGWFPAHAYLILEPDLKYWWKWYLNTLSRRDFLSLCVFHSSRSSSTLETTSRLSQYFCPREKESTVLTSTSLKCTRVRPFRYRRFLFSHCRNLQKNKKKTKPWFWGKKRELKWTNTADQNSQWLMELALVFLQVNTNRGR